MVRKIAIWLVVLMLISLHTRDIWANDNIQSEDATVAKEWTKYNELFRKTKADRERIKMDSGYRTLFNQQKDRYGYKDWPGKSGPVHGLIILEKSFLAAHNIFVPERYLKSDNRYFQRITLYPSEEGLFPEFAMITMEIFESCEDAQETLVTSLMTSSGILFEMVGNKIGVGDIALAIGSKDRFILKFVRNNVFIDLRGQEEKVIKQALEIDLLIQKSPSPAGMFSLPALVLTKELAKEFSIKRSGLKTK